MQKKYITLQKLETFLASLRTTFAPLSHTHKISEVSDYQIDDTLSSISTNPIANKTVTESLQSINSSITSLTNSKADATDLTSHSNNKENPHNVSSSQLGLATESWIFTLSDGSTVTKKVVIK